MEHDQELRELIQATSLSINLPLAVSQIDQFLTYIRELSAWNQRVNLTGIDRPRDIVVKHFIDSIAALTVCPFPLQSIVIDIGSGAGFPGIPLKIVRADLDMLLIEPVHKKTSFLKSLIGQLKLDGISIFDGTIEKYAIFPNGVQADFVLIRALKFEKIQNFVAKILKPQGKVTLYRTETISRSVPDSFILSQEKHFSLPLGYGQRVISVIAMEKEA